MSSEAIVVGCPVAGREWILPTWFNSVAYACEQAGLTPEFVFVVPKTDEGVWEVIRDMKRHFVIEVIATDEEPRKDVRSWDADRFTHMVRLRNQLLRRVRQLAPQFFWSLDSDILPAPDALTEAIASIGAYDALGMCTYMSPMPDVVGPQRWEVGREFPSKGTIYKGKLCNRKHHETETGTMPVDCIMASKLMKRPAYMVDYEWHRDGEDVGWSTACAREQVHFCWCATAKCKHVMYPAYLHKVDPRVGF